jgi:hypothetical protein
MNPETLRREKLEVKNEDELFGLITLALSDPSNKEMPFTQILKHLGIEPMQLVDRRTMDIIMNYEAYRNNPFQFIDNQLWFESVIILNKLQPRLF